MPDPLWPALHVLLMYIGSGWIMSGRHDFRMAFTVRNVSKIPKGRMMDYVSRIVLVECSSSKVGAGGVWHWKWTMKSTNEARRNVKLASEVKMDQKRVDTKLDA
jgi:hypothetical protein